MNDLQEKKFDYSLVDEDTAEFLQEKEDNIKRSVGRAAYEIGKELKEAHEKVVGENQYSKSTFKKWCESMGIGQTTASRYIRYYKSFKGLPEGSDQLKELPIRVIASLSSKKTPDEVKEKIKNGEIKTAREMQALRKKIREEQRQKEKLQEQVEKLKNKEPETKIKEVEKEVIPDDYEDVKQKAERLEKAHQFIQEEKVKLEEKLRQAEKEKRETKKEIDDFQKLKEQVERLRKRKDDIGKQVDSAANLSKWVLDIKKILRNDLAPMRYSEDVINQAHDGIVIDNVMEVVELVRQWTFDIEEMIKETTNTINVEVLK